MENLSRIIKLSKVFHLLLSFLIIVIPIYYILYWGLINHIPQSLITVNSQPIPLTPNEIPLKLRAVGFLASLLPLSALIYGLLNVKKLFSFYKEGIVFSIEHTNLFKKIAKALLVWVVLSILYESAKSVIFSAGNPPGGGILEVRLSSPEITMLMVAGIVFVISWVMEEGRKVTEESELTI